MGEEKRGDETKPAEESPDSESRPANGNEETPAALRVIGAFGGIRPMANKLEVPVSTVQGWKERSVIPEARHGEIRAAAAAHKVTLDEADLRASAEGPPEGEAPEETPQETPGETSTEAPAEPAVAAASIAATQSSSDGGPRRSGLVGFFLGALVFALGAGGAVLTQDLWGGIGSSGGGGLAAGDDGLAEQLAALETRLAAIEAQPAAPELPGNLATADDLARLEGEIAALSGGGDAAADLAGQIQDLEARLAALDESATASANAGAEAATALGGLSGEVAGLDAALQELQGTVEQLKTRDAGQSALLWSAVGALRDALRYTGPFADQLADVTRLAGERPDFAEALAPLAPLADGGVASLADLRRDFPAAARDIVAAGYGDGEEGVLGEVLSRVSQVVSVRPIDGSEGDGTGAIVARAEGQLERGDLAAALAALDGLTGAAAEAAGPWRARAEQRLAADGAIARLNGLLAGQLAAGG